MCRRFDSCRGHSCDVSGHRGPGHPADRTSITAAFIGYLVGGFAGACIATVAIFTPIYLGVVIPGGWFIRHRDNAQVRAFVKGATAAAAGAIGGATVVLTRGAVVDLRTLGILLVSLLFVWQFKNKEPILVVFAAIVGILLKGV